MKLLDDYRRLLENKKYSFSTIKYYENAIKKLLNAFPGRNPKLLKPFEIEHFINKLVTKDNISQSYQKQLVVALKIFYNELLGKDYNLVYLYPDIKEKKLPVILDKQEVLSLINSIINLKHKAIISTIYSAGLRLEECLSLKVDDIDSERMIIRVNSGKGKKDREVPLPKKLLLLLRKYIKKYIPMEFLFEGQKGGKYSASSIQAILRKAVKEAKIDKNISPYNLRHSFATHLLESGTDISVIQKILGHKSVRTTQIYTQVSKSSIRNVIDPSDTL